MQQTMTKSEQNTNIAAPPTPIRYCLYSRKSSESDELQIMSIDSQIKEMLELAQKEGLEVMDIRKEAHSAKDSGQRPVFNQILQDIREGTFNGILAWAPDRLSRNAGDLGNLVDLMDQKLLTEIKTYGQKFTNSPSEKFMLMLLCSTAKLENDNKSVNVKRGLRAKVEQGLWIGQAPCGYLNEKRTDRKGHLLVDPTRAPIMKQMFEKVANEKWSGRQVYKWLKFEKKFKTRFGKHLSLSNVYDLLKNPFYTGTFEFPRESGKWYTGKHTPLINQDLFDRAQAHLTRDNIKRSATKEFAFTKLITCGLCGSGICADEKFKTLKDGTVNRYVYYCCTRARNINCKNGYIREEELVNQLLEIMDKVDLDKLGIKEKIEKEIDRYDKFRYGVLGQKPETSQNKKDVDIRNYAKYILKEGNNFEKRELLGCMKSKLVLNDKKLIIK